MWIELLIIGLVQGLVHGLTNMEVAYQWKAIDFVFPDERTRNESIRKGEFIRGNAVPLDVDVWNNGRDQTIFLTFPKFNKGIPVTLGTVSNLASGDGHMLMPYPDWSWHSQGNCEGMTSAFRTQVDKCGRLWVIDSGMIDLATNGRRLCQPQILLFILRTNELAGRHRFEDDLLKEGSILANLAVDLRNNNCDDAFVYIADVTSYAMIVFDAKRDKAWKAQSNTMYPYPPYGVFRANNAEFDLMDGILGMALAPISRGDRMLYYHSLASVRESWVPASVLRSERNFLHGQNVVPRQFYLSEEARSSQSVAQAFDKNGILYFGMMDDNSINCWNSETPYNSSNIHTLEKDNQHLQFASGLKIITNENGEEELWAMTDRFQLVMTQEMNTNEYNFRIVRGKVSALLKHSPCKKYKVIIFPDKYESQLKPSSGYYG